MRSPPMQSPSPSINSIRETSFLASQHQATGTTALDGSSTSKQRGASCSENMLKRSFRAPQLPQTSQTASEIAAVLQALIIKADERLAEDSSSSSSHPSSLPSKPDFKQSSIAVDKSSDAESMPWNMLLPSFRILRETAESRPGDPPLPTSRTKPEDESPTPVQHPSDPSPQDKNLLQLVNTIHGLLLHDEGVTRALSSLPDLTRKSLKTEAQYLGNCPSCDLSQPPNICSELPEHAATLVDNDHPMIAPGRGGGEDVDPGTNHPIIGIYSLSHGIVFPSTVSIPEHEHGHRAKRHAAEGTPLHTSSVSLTSDTRQNSVLTPSSRSGSVPSLTSVSTTPSPTIETISDAKEDWPSLTISTEEDARKRTSSLVLLSRAFSTSSSSRSVSVTSPRSRRHKNRSKYNASGPIPQVSASENASHKAQAQHKSSLAPQVVTSSEIDPTSPKASALSLLPTARKDAGEPKDRFFRDRIPVEEPEDVHSWRYRNQIMQHNSPAMEALSKVHPQIIRPRAGSLAGLVAKDIADASMTSSLPPFFSRVRTRALSLYPSMRLFSVSNELGADVEEQTATSHTPSAPDASPVSTPAHLPSSTPLLGTLPSRPSLPPQAVATSPSPVSKLSERCPSPSPWSRSSSKASGPSRIPVHRRLSRTPSNSLEVTLLSQQPHIEDDEIVPLPPLDPVLQAAERASKLLKSTVQCSTCGDRGKDFPRCGKCGEAWCSRQCRLKDLSSGGTKKHVCRPEKLALQQGAAATSPRSAPVPVAA